MADLITAEYLAGIMGQNAPDPLSEGGAAILQQYAPLISAASASFVNLCNRKTIAAASFTETRSGDNTDTLILRESPVLSITALSILGVAVPAFSASSAAGYALLDDGWTLQLFGSYFSAYPRAISVSYMAGYDPVPFDIQQAIGEMVLWKIAKMPRIDQVSISLNGSETTSFDRASMPQYVKDTIAQYTSLGGFRGAR